MKQSLKKSTRHKYEILKMLRDRGPISRQDVSGHFDLALPTISALLKDLHATGLIRSEGRRRSSGGRPPELVGINPDYGVALGAEISYRRIACALVNMLGEPVTEVIDKNARSLGASEALSTLSKLTGALIEKARDNRIVGAGIGVSGIIEEGNRVTRRLPFSVAWESVPVADWFEEKFGIRPLVMNNITGAALGEARSGEWGDKPALIYLHVGRGIAAGVSINGQPYPGAGGMAGEIGHVVIEPDGSLCYCGNRGCLESIASEDVIVENCREAVRKGCLTQLTDTHGRKLANLTLDDILYAANNGDKLSATLLEEAGGHIGRTAANMVNLMNPHVLVLGGLLADENSVFAESVTRNYESTVLSALRSSTRIGHSLHRERACIAGVSHMVIDQWFESNRILEDIASISGDEEDAAG